MTGRQKINRGFIEFRGRWNGGQEVRLTCDCSWSFAASPPSFLTSDLLVLGLFAFLAPTALTLAPGTLSWTPSCFLGLGKGRGLSCSPFRCLS